MTDYLEQFDDKAKDLIVDLLEPLLEYEKVCNINNPDEVFFSYFVQALIDVFRDVILGNSYHEKRSNYLALITAIGNISERTRVLNDLCNDKTIN